MAVLGGAADPLAVADQQVAELPAGVQLVEKPVGEVRPGHELEIHPDAGLGGEVLGQLDESICRVPGRPAQRELVLRLDRRDDERQAGEAAGERGGDSLVHFYPLPSVVVEAAARAVS